MTGNAILQCTLYVVVLVALAVPLGRYMARVYMGEATFAQRIVGPVERLFYRAAGVRADEEMGWRRYAAALLIFNVFGLLGCRSTPTGSAR
jgi:K+-transporting ATPase ATPase A chain